jgi:hypothetical protein
MLWASRTGSGRKMQEEVLTLMRSFDFVAACSDLVETHVRAEVIFKTLPKTGEEKE